MDTEKNWGFFPDFDSTLATGDTAAIDACEQGATVRIDAETASVVEIAFKNFHAIVPKAGLRHRVAPAFSWGDHVYIASKGIHAVIDDICWHFRDEYYYYYLVHEGKLLKKRYFAQDLEKE